MAGQEEEDDMHGGGYCSWVTNARIAEETFPTYMQNGTILVKVRANLFV